MHIAQSQYKKQVAEDTIELKIDRLAGLGDGVGTHNGRKVFVPYAASGDIIRARIAKVTANADYATIVEILSPGPERIEPVCRHFTRCGGCALQHISHSAYAGFKLKMAQEAARKAGFDTDCVAQLVTFPANTRRRADLKVRNGKIGFFEEYSHRIVDIEECTVLEPDLLELVMQTKRQLPGLPEITRIRINGVDNGYDVMVEGQDGCKLQVTGCKQVRRLSIAGQKTIYQSGEVTLTLGSIVVDVPAGAFLQASRAAQAFMTERVQDAVKDSDHVLDLFAGIGTYSFPVSANSKLTAIEGDKAMVTAMQDAARKYKLENILRTERRDLFNHPLKRDELSGYDAVIINPPRAGAKAQAGQLAQAGIAKIVMVSCNPATFARDARLLKEGGYQLLKLTPVDQFVYSSHLELIAEFIRR